MLLGLKETQSSPLLMALFWITMLLLRYVSHPSVFLAVLFEVDNPDMLMLLYTTEVLFATQL